MRWRILVLVLLLAFAFSCGPSITQGTRIDAEKRSQVLKGQTTAEQVVGLFGKPEKVEKLPTGGEKYIYNYYYEGYDRWYRPHKYDKQKLEVSIKEGIVQDYLFIREFRGEITDQDK